MQCSGLREGLVVNVKKDDVGELQALRVMHRHNGHRALLRGPAPGANGNVVLAQLAGNLLPPLVGAGEHTYGDILRPLRPFLDVRGKHCHFLRLRGGLHHNGCGTLAHRVVPGQLVYVIFGVYPLSARECLMVCV